jgi:polyvinyl alcohol dehydrogenase (cytochrome)
VTAAVLALSGCDWTFFHGNVSGTGVAPDPGPDASQVASLHKLWGFHPGYSIYATPVTRGGTMFLAAGNGTLYALDMRTISGGAPVVRWSRAYGLKTEHYCGSPQGFVSSPTVTDDASGNPRVLLYTPQGTLQELDGGTGNVLWQSTVYAIPNDNQDDYYSWATPLVANGLVYVGVSSDCDKPFVPSGLLAFDVRTGALVAVHHTLPATTDPNAATRTYTTDTSGVGPPPPSNLYAGAAIWTSPVTDGQYVYVTTGSTYGDTDSAHPPRDDNAFDQYSLLKLDAHTLATVGKFAVPQPQSIVDPDWGSTPTLFTATIGGSSVPMVGACNKDGNFYALRRDTMRPVWEVQVQAGTSAGQHGCLPAATFANGRLYVAANVTSLGATWSVSTMSSPSGYSWPHWTSSGGTAAAASLRALDPATGLALGATPKPPWESALPSPLLAACSTNGKATIIACQTMDWTDTFNTLVLTDATNGRRLRELNDASNWAGFATPVWVDGMLIGCNWNDCRAFAP